MFYKLSLDRKRTNLNNRTRTKKCTIDRKHTRYKERTHDRKHTCSKIALVLRKLSYTIIFIRDIHFNDNIAIFRNHETNYI